MAEKSYMEANKEEAKRWLKEHSYLWCQMPSLDNPFILDRSEKEDWAQVNKLVNSL